MMIKHTLTEVEIVQACREFIEQRVSIEGEVKAAFEVDSHVMAGVLTLTFTSEIETYRS